MVAVLLEKSEQCDMCGTSPWQWDEDMQAFVATEDVCMGCYHRDIARDARDAAKKAGETGAAGMKIRLVRPWQLVQREAKTSKRPKSARERVREEVDA